MEFMVVGADGTEYGPAGIDVLKQWVAENRLGPETVLRNFQTGVTTPAGRVAELFPSPPPAASSYATPPSYAQYPRSSAPAPVNATNEIARAVLYAVGAVVSFFLLGGIGLIFGVYGVMYAVKVMQKGHKAGIVCLVVSIVAIGAVAAGWALGLRGIMLRH